MRNEDALSNSLTQAVGRGAGQGEQQVKSLNAARYSYFPLKGFELHIRDGRNLLAIEDNNATSDSHDLFVDLGEAIRVAKPCRIIKPPRPLVFGFSSH